MIALLQRVTKAKVEVKGEQVANIKHGLLVLVGIEANDGTAQLQRLAERLLNYRVFADQSGKMNLNVCQVMGEIILVPQFTLAVNTNSGNRPSFSAAAPPELGAALFDQFVNDVKSRHQAVQSGVFGADMQVTLVNDGPVTFWLQVTA